VTVPAGVPHVLPRTVPLLPVREDGDRPRAELITSGPGTPVPFRPLDRNGGRPAAVPGHGSDREGSL
jgi:hypothetical protein